MILDALLGIGRALVSGAKSFAVSLIAEVVHELDRSPLGKVIAKVISGSTSEFLRRAQDLSEEEGELAQKYQRDGKQSELDVARAREIAKERELLRKEFEVAKSKEAVEKLQESDVLAPITPDEISAVAGVITLKKNCPNCDAPMRIRQSGNKIGQNPDTNGRTFWWQCTATGLRPCPTVRLDPLQYSTQVIRPENPDLDGSAKGRREVWTNDNTLVRTHARVRSHLGDSDNEMICPKHLLPMKLLERRRGSGKLLDNYEYVCLAVDADGRACNYSIGLETFPQVAETLRRSEGVGIVGST